MKTGTYFKKRHPEFILRPASQRGEQAQDGERSRTISGSYKKFDINPRYIIAVVIFVCVLLTRVNFLSNNSITFCKLQDIVIDVPLQLQEAITMDGGQSPILTRFFHNKLLFYGMDFTQCYLKYFHPLFLLNFTGFLGFLMFIYGFYQLFKSWNILSIKIFLMLFFVIPLLSITVNFGFIIVNYIFSLFLWFIIFYGVWVLTDTLRLFRRS